MSLELSPADQAFQALATQPLEVVLQQLGTWPKALSPHDFTGFAVKHNRIDLFRHLLQSNAGKEHQTSVDVKVVVWKQSQPLLQELLDSGFDINENIGSYQGCVLTCAILSRATDEMIEWLLDRGADPNGVYGGVDHCGHSLRLYVQMSDIDKPTKAARMLIERGADVNASKRYIWLQ
ncbi:hypothetical protein B9Z65_151 [Elsinoe australis]|uniref:Uncharacterized protein n=1 Tax=Elsinoe australis TaxID=40998 RepID=A0A2P7Z7I8_9PEZI|nr:hypothetical protein B9Z65_151 [Elsinoe australis]